MPATRTMAYDFVTAKAVANLLGHEDIRAVVEEYEIGMAYIRLDPDDEDPTGYMAVATDTVEDSDDGGWMMLPTFYDENMHTYESVDDAEGEPLGVPADADPEEVAEAIANFLA